MGDPDTHPTEPPVDLLTAVREWIWRHSSQPNGDPWDGDPEHLDLAAHDLLDDLAQWVMGPDPEPDSSPHTSAGGAPQDPLPRPRR